MTRQQRLLVAASACFVVGTVLLVDGVRHGARLTPETIVRGLQAAWLVMFCGWLIALIRESRNRGATHKVTR